MKLEAGGQIRAKGSEVDSMVNKKSSEKQMHNRAKVKDAE